ncbi:uncharacterized protein LOC111261090 isoform X2 [Varroa jacobsoni]|uniref:uncharacterized protein LOC111261090 isoform X2 n=1 Tax=Varroa jacobsoni TaxID=62625 RepID=UPI000BF5D608|nr:uncharacterized protein LOC111261090 isoform X2 [Varroa jacobsoni]
MFFGSVGLLIFLHMYCATTMFPKHMLRYPDVIRQFRDADPWFLKSLPDFNKFFVSQISVQKINHSGESIYINKELMEIDVKYGKIEEYRSTIAGIYGILYQGIDTIGNGLSYDKALVTFNVSMPFDEEPNARLEIGSSFPGIFEVIAMGTTNYVPVKNIWKLHSIPLLVTEEGRYFNISLDFITISGYLNLEWNIKSNSVLLYGMPGVGELDPHNTIMINFKKEPQCLYRQQECSQIKVNIKSELWNSGYTVRPSFEATFATEFSLVDDRISAAKCIAELYGVQIMDLHGLQFVSQKLERQAKGPSVVVSKMNGTILHKHLDCDIIQRIKEMKYPARLPQCEWSLLSLKHDLNYGKKRCDHFESFHPKEIGKPDRGDPTRYGDGLSVASANADGQLRLMKVIGSSMRSYTTVAEIEGTEKNLIPHSAGEHENGGSENSTEVATPSNPKPSWGELHDIPYKSRLVHLTIIFSALAGVAITAFISVLCYYWRRDLRSYPPHHS